MKCQKAIKKPLGPGALSPFGSDPTPHPLRRPPLTSWPHPPITQKAKATTPGLQSPSSDGRVWQNPLDHPSKVTFPPLI